jgi:hypothetical protein
MNYYQAQCQNAIKQVGNTYCSYERHPINF